MQPGWNVSKRWTGRSIFYSCNLPVWHSVSKWKIIFQTSFLVAFVSLFGSNLSASHRSSRHYHFPLGLHGDTTWDSHSPISIADLRLLYCTHSAPSSLASSPLVFSRICPRTSCVRTVSFLILLPSSLLPYDKVLPLQQIHYRQDRCEGLGLGATACKAVWQLDVSVHMSGERRPASAQRPLASVTLPSSPQQATFLSGDSIHV